MRVARIAAIATIVGAGLTLAGCGTPIRLGPASEPTPEASVVQFCADFTAAGGDSSTVGPLQLSLPRERLSAQIRERLQRMGDLEPPRAISDSWRSYKKFYADVQLALDGQADGTTLDDDDLIETGLELFGEARIVRNFYLTYCDRAGGR